MYPPHTCGVDHTGQLRHHPSTSSAVIVWKVVGQHLILNIIPNNFTVGTKQRVWCDQGMCLGPFVWASLFGLYFVLFQPRWGLHGLILALGARGREFLPVPLFGMDLMVYSCMFSINATWSDEYCFGHEGLQIGFSHSEWGEPTASCKWK